MESQLVELQRAMHAMTEDPANRSRLYLTDEEVRMLKTDTINPRNV